MILRKYKNSDLNPVVKLFKDTVYAVNSRDYKREQIDAWAGGKIDLDSWQSSLSAHDTIVALEGNLIVGFGDAAKDGYLDRLYVHKDFQRMGVAKKYAICSKSSQIRNIYIHSCINNSPRFFRKKRILPERRATSIKERKNPKKLPNEKIPHKNSIRRHRTCDILT